MLKKYPEISPNEEVKSVIHSSVINSILNYSKSVEVKKVKKEKLLINLN